MASCSAALVPSESSGGGACGSPAQLLQTSIILCEQPRGGLIWYPLSLADERPAVALE